MTSAQSQNRVPTAGWDDPDQVDWYLDRIEGLPPRIAGEDVLREVLPRAPETVLDLRPDGLEVVASATPELHAEFLTASGRTGDDPEDRLVGVETQMGWMCEAGLEQVDCLWRWRAFALLVGRSR
ncbi:MAG TPA: hypothetical protein VNV87_13880 [Acidimicrobiales bacterium]|nr:hypothetical protein [Acidimicrobiales bacterium]